MSTIQDETLQQHAALMGAWEWEHTSTGTGTPKVICRVYRDPNHVYTNNVRNAGPIWIAQAVKKPPINASGTDHYLPNWTGADDEAKQEAARNHYTSDPPDGQVGRSVNSSNVKIARVFTFADAKLRAVLMANTITS